jgi:hypothetical protein
LWDGKRGDILIHRRSFAGESAVQVPAPAFGISSYNAKARTSEVFVSDASRDNHHVTGINPYLLTLLTAEVY